MERAPGNPESREKHTRAVIISGFPGIGKSSVTKDAGDRRILDSDSMAYSWSDESKTERHPAWPKNYIDHIESSADKSDAILVSTHKDVRDALVLSKTPFTLVYPSLEMKDEYIQRYIDRGSSPEFVTLLQENYESWISELMAQEGCTHVVLKPGQYLADVLGEIR